MPSLRHFSMSALGAVACLMSCLMAAACAGDVPAPAVTRTVTVTPSPKRPIPSTPPIASSPVIPTVTPTVISTVTPTVLPEVAQGFLLRVEAIRPELTNDDLQMVRLGQDICARIARGENREDVIAYVRINASTPTVQVTADQAAGIVEAAMTELCRA